MGTVSPPSDPHSTKGCDVVLMLSHDRWVAALAFLEGVARPLDRALAHYLFCGAPADAVADELAAFQNPDGGLGHAMEPDFALEISSVLATTVGLQYADLAGLDAKRPVVRNALAYLVRMYDHDQERWHALPQAVNDVAHAPWWSVDPLTGRSSVECHWANPSAEVVGHLNRHRAVIDPTFLSAVMDVAHREWDAVPHPIDLHDLLCWVRWAETLSGAERAGVLQRLGADAQAIVTGQESEWEAYGAKPLTLAPTPTAPFAARLRALVDLNLDYEIRRQAEDGSWRPNWSWGQFPEEWARAEVAWAGHLTLHTLRSLQAYGRIGI